MKTLNVGLLGYGNVGRGVGDILRKHGSQIGILLQSEVKIKKILVRNMDKYIGMGLNPAQLTQKADEILLDPDIDAVIELIGGIDPAYQYIREALSQGKHVITANKAVIAKHGTELLILAAEQNVSLRFEGSVAGGIPIVSALTQSLTANSITSVIGIVNGTTNYILTRMTKDAMTLQSALALAQEKGYAEANAASDIEGEDAAYKLSILAQIAFGVQADPMTVPREGIQRISSKEIEYAAQLGYVIKLLAKAKMTDAGLELHVHPALVSGEHPLASVSNEFNALYVEGDFVGELLFYGKGAGSHPTASAVVGDLIDAIRSACEHRQKPHIPQRKDVKALGETSGEYYIRLEVKDRPGVLGKITTRFGRHNVSLASVVQRDRGTDVVPLIFVTHTIPRPALDSALADIGDISEVVEIASILRVESF